MLRFVGALLTLAVAIAAFVVTWPQLFGLQSHPLLALIVSWRTGLVVVAAVIAIILLIVVIGSRRARPFAGGLLTVTVLFGAANAGVAAWRGADQIFAPAEFTAPSAEGLTVLSWNTLGSAPGMDAVRGMVIGAGAQIVVLPETLPEDAHALRDLLREDGRDFVAHGVAFNGANAVLATSVLIDRSLGDYRLVSGARPGENTTALLPSLELEPVRENSPRILAVHAAPPHIGGADMWRSDLDWIASRCAAESGETIIAGDLNATNDHFSGRGVDGGVLGACRDAAASDRQAAVGTWPTNLPALTGVPIDHVLWSGDRTLEEFRVVVGADDSGSDHRPIIARFAAG